MDAKFPNSVWDGSSATRKSNPRVREIFREPDGADWDAVVDEMIAVQQYLKTNPGGGAPLDSPEFTGTPTAPTPDFGTSDDTLATTAFVAESLGNTIAKTGDEQEVTAPIIFASKTVSRSSGATTVVSATISNVSLSNNNAEITTTTTNQFVPGEVLTISGLTTTALNGQRLVLTRPASNKFTFRLVNADIPSTPDTGTASLSRATNNYEFQNSDSDTTVKVDNAGGWTFQRDLPSEPPRFGDWASISIRQTRGGILGDDVCFAIWDANYFWTETADKPGLSIQTYFLADGSYYSGRSFIVSQDREKTTNRIAQMGGQTMIGGSGDINAPTFKSQNQLNIVGEKFRYCYAAYDAADPDPNYPPGDKYSDRGFGKNKWLCGPQGQQLYGAYLNPDGDDSDPELHRSAKHYWNPTTGNYTFEGSGQTATTTIVDFYGPPGGNAQIRLGSRDNQNAMFIGTAASSDGIGQLGLGGVSFINFYNTAIGVAGVAVGIGVDDASSALTVSTAPSNVGVCGITSRGKPGQLGSLFRAQDSDWNNLWEVNKAGYMLLSRLTPIPDADLDDSQLSFSFDDSDGAAKLVIKAKSANGTVVTGELALA